MTRTPLKVKRSKVKVTIVVCYGNIQISISSLTFVCCKHNAYDLGEIEKIGEGRGHIVAAARLYSLFLLFCCFMEASSIGLCLSGNREINMMMMMMTADSES